MNLTEAALSATAAVAVVNSGLMYAAMSPSSQIFGPVMVAGDDPKQIALTYDDGPNPAATGKLLEIFAKHDVRATFFLLGGFVRLEPGLTREIAAAGHLIGNHSMSHPRLPMLRTRRIREELAGCKALIEDTIGIPVRFFRPPFGWRRPAVLRVARELGMTTVEWNVMVGDWNPVSATTIFDRMCVKVARNQRAGRASNIVLHDGGQAGLNLPRLATVEATARLIERFPEAQYVTPVDWL